VALPDTETRRNMERLWLIFLAGSGLQPEPECLKIKNGSTGGRLNQHPGDALKAVKNDFDGTMMP